MSTNSREAMRAAFEADQFADLVPDAGARDREGDGYRYLVVDCNWRIWQAAWTASRQQAMEEAQVWCGCGDGITAASGAKCGNCIAAEGHA